MLEKTAQIRNDNLAVDLLDYIDALDLTDISYSIALQTMDHPSSSFGLLRSHPIGPHEPRELIALELSVTHENDEVSDLSKVRGLDVHFVDRKDHPFAGYLGFVDISPETVRSALVESAHAHAELHRDHFRKLRN